jgi:ATP-dependent exoDNAse (exonuclease V) beta subunit
LHGDVVWWDPSKLRLNVQPKMGLVNENLLVEGDPEGLQRFQDWQQARRQTIEQGRQKSVEIVIPSEGSAPGTELPVEMLAIAKQPGRPSGRRFGTLVHALLRDADLNAGAEEIQKSAESQGRTLGAPASERAAASRAVTAVLSHSLLQSARGADRCLRESPVTLPLPDGKILEGTVDLAFLENGTWTVVDFKTDVNVAAHRTHYVRQLQWYAAAFAEITKASTRAILFDL